ncbi:MAG: tetratricopeptide repeat protein [Longimicrobiales bacterium]
MNLEALKEKARRHEQKEEWNKALQAYRQVIQKQAKDEVPDITLYNRIGDIHTRVKSIDAAVESYEKAVDLYLEAELPNNAIAICKKVLRNLPDRSIFFLRMGQIRGAQGFLTDAKQAFLTYAERMTAAGNLDAALDALIELVEIIPDDLGIRMGLASQLESHLRSEEAVEQYTEAYRHLVLQERFEEIEAVVAKIDELDPETVLPDIDEIRAGAEAQARAKPPLAEVGLGAFELGSGVQGVKPAGRESLEGSGEGDGAAEDRMKADEEEAGEEAPEPLPTLSFEDEEEGAIASGAEGSSGGGEEDHPAVPAGVDGGGEESGDGLPMLEMDYEEAGEILRTFGMAEEELAEAIPAFGEGSEEGAGVEKDALPTLPFQEEETEEEAEPLPTLEFGGAEQISSGEALEGALEDAAFEAGIDDSAPGEAPPSPSPHQQAADAGDLDLAMELVRAEIEARPDEVELYQRQVEYAFRKGERAVLVPAYLELANCLVRAGSPVKARSVFQQVLALSPSEPDAHAGLQELADAPAGAPPAQVAHSEEYVDLGSLILGEETEKTTRWQVTAETPSGDDQADFAKMLNQFKEKVSENVDADDLSAHHDLGTAYLEMGLLDEAIGEFQMALRASPAHLPTHEVMGRCWMEIGRPEMAVRALNRALNTNFDVEDELIGIYYIMGRAKEELGNTEEAVEFYEKVFSLDINFEDVTERLRSLR